MVSGREASGPLRTGWDPMAPLEPERTLPPARWPLAPTLDPGVPGTETQKCLCSLGGPWNWGCGLLLGSGGQNLQARESVRAYTFLNCGARAGGREASCFCDQRDGSG